MSLVLGRKNEWTETSATKSIHNRDYDSLNDILYISFASTANSYGDESIDGIVILKDIDTDEITGLTVFSPSAKAKQRRLQLDSLGFDFVDISV